MNVIGIDPGSRKTGYGILSANGSVIQLIASGVIKTDPKQALPDRLTVIKSALDRLIETYRPTQAAVESVFYALNAKTSLILGQVRGAVLVTLASQGVHIHEFSPKQIKLATVGYGNADKQQVQHMVRMILNTQRPFQEDEADAVAAGICCLHSKQTPYSHSIGSKAIDSKAIG